MRVIRSWLTEETVFKLTNDTKQVNVVSVIVRKDSSYQKLQDLKNKEIGQITIGQKDLIEKTTASVNQEMKQQVQWKMYDSYLNYADDLYNGNLDAIIVNDANRGLLKVNHTDFEESIRVIATYTYESDTEDIAKRVDVTKEPFSIFISGIDTYGSVATASRSDVNMIVTVHPITHTILMTSIPRDYYLPQPCQNQEKDKLTHAGIYGMSCSVKTIENSFTVPFNYYIRVNFSSVIDIVNALGGVTVDNPQTFTAIEDTVFKEGQIQLNGKDALTFARERKAFADGDHERGRNQMRVMDAIIDKALSPTIITNYMEILGAVDGSFQTNFSTEEIISFIRMQLAENHGWTIQQISVSGKGIAEAWSPANGFYSWVMEPDQTTMNHAVELIHKVLAGTALSKQDIEKQAELVAAID